jgi:hypothetical protein
MPADIRVIRAHDFVRANEMGKFDLQESMRLLGEVALSDAVFEVYDILLDTREAHSEMSAQDLWEMAVALRRLGSTLSRKIAVLVPAERLEHAKFFAATARREGYRVFAFTSLGDALEWLIGKLEITGSAAPFRARNSPAVPVLASASDVKR